MTVSTLPSTEKLPVDVLEYPHWRVNFRPSTYSSDRIESVTECRDILSRSSVRLGEWDFPMIYPFSDRIHDEDTWAAGSSNYDGHIEYWRFYQSSQFLYLGAIREETDRALKDALQGRWNSRANRSSNGDAVSRFLGLTNTVYNITEYFELASRLAQARIYREPVTISISLKDVAGFGLVADLDWRMMNEYVSQETQLDYPVTLTPADLVSSSAKHAMKCILWLYKKFGWANPNIDAIRTDQERLLSQRT